MSLFKQGNFFLPFKSASIGSEFFFQWPSFQLDPFFIDLMHSNQFCRKSASARFKGKDKKATSDKFPLSRKTMAAEQGD
jgi:hypothetical protein